MNQDSQLPVILIADDSPDDRLLLKRLLRKAGVANPLVFAESGEAAISLLQNSCLGGETPSAQTPAVAFLDINMPPGNGLCVLEWIRSHRAFLETRVIMMTDSTRPEHMQLAEELKADGYVLKHPQPEAIAFLLQTTLAAGTSGGALV